MKRLPDVLAHPSSADVRLRAAAESDRERLRRWKNEHKKSFFHQEDITPEQQASWFAGYLGRPDDHVYLVEESVGGEWCPVGVVACRLLDNTVDIYNIMRGCRTSDEKANMGEALLLLCARIQAEYDVPISCKVLTANPAMAWYERLGFAIEERCDGYNLLMYKKGSLT